MFEEGDNVENLGAEAVPHTYTRGIRTHLALHKFDFDHLGFVSIEGR